jgi:hypothetical protein
MTMRPAPRGSPATTLLLVGSAAVVVVSAVAPPHRAWVVIPYLLLAPGCALVPLLRLHDPLMEAALVIAVGVVLLTAVALAMVWSGVWSGWVVAASAVAATVAGALAQRAAAVRAADGHGAPAGDGGGR